MFWVFGQKPVKQKKKKEKKEYYVTTSYKCIQVAAVYRGFSRQPHWRAETMKQFCMKIDLISHWERKCIVFCPPTWRQ